MADTTSRSRFAPLLIGLAAMALFHAVIVVNKLCDPEEPSMYTHASWDEGYYLGIARDGYLLSGDDYRIWSTLPFSPGYPYLLRGFCWLTRLDHHVARIVLSSILFLIACVGLGALYRTFSSDSKRNNLAIALFVCWPGSLYFMTGYAEALYLPLAVWCLVCLRRRRFLAASCLAGLALFTRSPAIILVPTVCVVVVVDWLRRPPSGEGGRLELGWRPISGLLARLGLYVSIISLGLIGYMGVMWAAVGDPIAFLKAYAAWNAVNGMGLDNYAMVVPLRSILFHGADEHWPAMLGMAFFLLMPLWVFPVRTKLPLDLVAFTMIGWLFFLSQNGQQNPFLDIMRWSAILFPAHYCVAIWIERAGSRFRPHLAVAILLVFAAIYAWMLTRFIHSQWVS